MRSQTPLFLLKKNENCRKIITVSSTVLGAGGGGTIMAKTERLPPKGVPFSGFRYMKGKGFFIVEVYERDICHFS